MKNTGDKAGSTRVVSPAPQQNVITIEIPDKRWVSGETVKGHVHLNICKAEDVSEIFVQLKGLEKVSWSAENSCATLGYNVDGFGDHDAMLRNFTRANALKHKVVTFDKCFISVKQPMEIPPSKGSLLVGQYSFPFEMTLPDDLPGSFHVENLSVSLTYTLSAVCTVKGLNKANVETHMNLSVLQAMTPWVDSSLTCSKSHEQLRVNTCGLCLNGFVNWHAETDKLQYNPGDTAIVYVSVDNETSRVVRNFKLALAMNICIQGAEGGDFNRTLVLYESLYDVVISPRTKKDRLVLEFPILSETPPVSHGYFWNSTHKIVLSCAVEAAASVNLELPVVALQQRPHEIETSKKIPLEAKQWNPTVMPRSTIHVPQLDPPPATSESPIPSIFKSGRLNGVLSMVKEEQPEEENEESSSASVAVAHFKDIVQMALDTVALSRSASIEGEAPVERKSFHAQAATTSVVVEEKEDKHQETVETATVSTQMDEPESAEVAIMASQTSSHSLTESDLIDAQLFSPKSTVRTSIVFASPKIQRHRRKKSVHNA